MKRKPANNLLFFISHDANSVVAGCSSEYNFTSQASLKCSLTVALFAVVQGTKGTAAATLYHVVTLVELPYATNSSPGGPALRASLHAMVAGKLIYRMHLGTDPVPCVKECMASASLEQQQTMYAGKLTGIASLDFQSCGQNLTHTKSRSGQAAERHTHRWAQESNALTWYCTRHHCRCHQSTGTVQCHRGR